MPGKFTGAVNSLSAADASREHRKDWGGYVTVIGGVLGGVGTIVAAVVAVFALQAQDRAK